MLLHRLRHRSQQKQKLEGRKSITHSRKKPDSRESDKASKKALLYEVITAQNPALQGDTVCVCLIAGGTTPGFHSPFRVGVGVGGGERFTSLT